MDKRILVGSMWTDAEPMMAKRHKKKAALPMPNPLAAASSMGRPALFKKPLPKTFMMSVEASAILDRKAKEMNCSRSDVLDMAIKFFNRGRK